MYEGIEARVYIFKGNIFILNFNKYEKQQIQVSSWSLW